MYIFDIDANILFFIRFSEKLFRFFGFIQHEPAGNHKQIVEYLMRFQYDETRVIPTALIESLT